MLNSFSANFGVEEQVKVTRISCNAKHITAFAESAVWQTKKYHRQNNVRKTFSQKRAQGFGVHRTVKQLLNIFVQYNRQRRKHGVDSRIGRVGARSLGGVDGVLGTALGYSRCDNVPSSRADFGESRLCFGTVSGRSIHSPRNPGLGDATNRTGNRAILYEGKSR